ncbi:hypothetical protein GGR53DRAFT_479309 [Hypoxylon sp. FL1150]|nr:hypothetical protein GGR53DRAFT_479309 [Hypoxylon sp. FL1150]
MSLSNETIIGILTLLVMCAPAACLLRLARRQMSKYNFRRTDNNAALLPITNPHHQLLRHLYDDSSPGIHLREFFTIGRPGPGPIVNGMYLRGTTSHYQRVDVTMSLSSTTVHQE